MNEEKHDEIVEVFDDKIAPPTTLEDAIEIAEMVIDTLRARIESMRSDLARQGR